MDHFSKYLLGSLGKNTLVAAYLPPDLGHARQAQFQLSHIPSPGHTLQSVHGGMAEPLSRDGIQFRLTSFSWDPLEVLRAGGGGRVPRVVNSGPNNTRLKEGVLAYQKIMGESLAQHQIACAKTVQENHTQARMKSGCNEGLFPKNQ